MTYSKDAIGAVEGFVDKFKFKEPEFTEEVLDYRMGLLKEEWQETDGAFRTSNPEELVDGHVDIIVIALGNLAMMGVDIQKAFDEVMRANMSKELGKRSLTDPDGVSIIKPQGWVGPDHKDNHGKLEAIFSED